MSCCGQKRLALAHPAVAVGSHPVSKAYGATAVRGAHAGGARERVVDVVARTLRFRCAKQEVRREQREAAHHRVAARVLREPDVLI